MKKNIFLNVVFALIMSLAGYCVSMAGTFTPGSGVIPDSGARGNGCSLDPVSTGVLLANGIIAADSVKKLSKAEIDLEINAPGDLVIPSEDVSGKPGSGYYSVEHKEIISGTIDNLPEGSNLYVITLDRNVDSGNWYAQGEVTLSGIDETGDISWSSEVYFGREDMTDNYYNVKVIVAGPGSPALEETDRLEYSNGEWISEDGEVVNVTAEISLNKVCYRE